MPFLDGDDCPDARRHRAHCRTALSGVPITAHSHSSVTDVQYPFPEPCTYHVRCTGRTASLRSLPHPCGYPFPGSRLAWLLMQKARHAVSNRTRAIIRGHHGRAHVLFVRLGAWLPRRLREHTTLVLCLARACPWEKYHAVRGACPIFCSCLPCLTWSSLPPAGAVTNPRKGFSPFFFVPWFGA